MTPEQLAAKGLRVKELEWVMCDFDWFAEADTGVYSVFEARKGHWRWDRSSSRTHSGVRFIRGACLSLEAAKAAAQADYEARVLAALVEVQ